MFLITCQAKQRLPSVSCVCIVWEDLFWWEWCYPHKRRCMKTLCPLTHWCCWRGQEGYPSLWIQNIPLEFKCCRWSTGWCFWSPALKLGIGWYQQNGAVVSKTKGGNWSICIWNRSLHLSRVFPKQVPQVTYWRNPFIDLSAEQWLKSPRLNLGDMSG